MSTEKARRDAKKREKSRKKREEARRTRGSRKPVGGPASADLSDALEWPIGDAWVGQDWHERGARVDVLFTRRHADGRVAVVVFELDLAERGVLAVRAANPVTEDAVQGELVRRSAEERAMVAADPALVVKLVRSAERHGRSRGHATPVGYEAATAIFGAVREEDASEEILCGDEAPSAAEPVAQEGFFAGLKRRLGLGG